MIPKGPAFLPSLTLDQLNEMARSEKDRKPHMRLLVAIHRKKGWTLERSAVALGIPVTTTHDWLMRFHKGGLNRLFDTKQPGRPPAISQKQRRELVTDLERGPPHNPGGLWTTKQVKDLLKRKYGIEYVNQHVWRLLTSLGFSLQRPRKQHYKRPEKEVLQQFKKKRGDNPSIIVPKGLLWARRMKPRSDSSPSSPESGRDEEAGQS